LWNLYVYKTNPPPRDSAVDTTAEWDLYGDAWTGGTYNQKAPPFDTWKLLYGPSYHTAGPTTLTFDDFAHEPRHHCYTYYDAFKLEYVRGGGDGGASSSTVALSDALQRVRVMPNPARRTARVSYVVPKPGRVEVVVYDVTGRAVLRTPQVDQRAGIQTATISVAGLPAGTYMARVGVNGVHTTCRFVVCR
jgi:hypothetical protein